MKINPVSPQAAAHRPAGQTTAGDGETATTPAFTLSLSDHAGKVLKGGSAAAAGSTAHRAAQMIQDDPGAYADYKNFGQIVASLVRQDAAEAEAASETVEVAAEEAVSEPVGDDTVVVEDPIETDPPVEESAAEPEPEITVDGNDDALVELIEDSENDSETA